MATTITVDNPTPKQGETIAFHVVTDVTGTGCKVTIQQPGGTTFSSVEYLHADPLNYDKKVGLYAPNWPAGTGGQLVAEVETVARARGGKIRTTKIASLGLTVAP